MAFLTRGQRQIPGAIKKLHQISARKRLEMQLVPGIGGIETLLACNRFVRLLIKQNCDAITGKAKLRVARAGAYRGAVVATALDSLHQHFRKIVESWRRVVQDERRPMIPGIAIVEDAGSPRVTPVIQYAQPARLQLLLNQFFLLLQR